MNEKTQIEEKRVRSTVIRRRKTVVEQPPKIEASLKTKKAADIEKVDKVKEKVAVAKEEIPLKELPQDSQPVLSTETQVTVTLEVVSKSVTESQPAQTAETAKKETVTKTAEGAPPKKFSRVGEIIELPKTPPRASQQLGKGIEDETEEGGEKDKKGKIKKPIKKKESRPGMEIDGIGKVSTLTHLTRIVHTDRIERVFEPSRVGKRKRVVSKKSQKATSITISKPIKRIIEMGQAISVGELANAMGVKAGEIIKRLMAMDMMVTVNHPLDFDTASLLAHEYQYEVKDISFNEEKILKQLEKGSDEKLVPRPPVVTVMGHVDHGKTSLLDAIRQTNVTEGEFGGITQHIGAYTVNLSKGKITFLDTPGHEAFTAMRARGAAVTDIVILVVAADDGMMPQTIESIHHAKEAKVPIVVAVNKIDKPEANIDRIKRQLSEQGLISEDWGGDTLFNLVSAKQKTGIEELLESVLLQAEVLELKANPEMPAKGVVVEARLDRNRGPVATVLVQQGTLKVGDPLVAGCYAGHIRAMMDYVGKPTKEAPPSTAVEIMGLDGVPLASDLFHVTPNEKTAISIAQHRQDEKRKIEMVPASKVSLEDFFAKSAMMDLKELNVILKTDVQGSLEAVKEALVKLATERVKIRLIHSGVGGINESDVLLAQASGAVIIGFNVRPETKAIATAERAQVDIKLYKIIYDMVNEVKLAMRGLLAPTKKEKYLGRAEIRQTFTVSHVGTVAGCYVIDGKIVRGAFLRLLRDNVVIHEGKISTLKRIKDDVKEVLQGFECGMSVEGYQDVKEGDVIEAFEIEYIQAEL